MRMRGIFSRKLTGIALAAMMAFVIGGQSAIADDSGLVTVAAKDSYSDTVSALKTMVAKNGMMVLGEINQGKVMKMTGMNLKSVSLFVGNPTMGKKMFTADAGAGIVLPARVDVYEQDGHTFIRYFKPSVQFASFNKKLVMPGQMLDKKIGMMISMLAK